MMLAMMSQPENDMRDIMPGKGAPRALASQVVRATAALAAQSSAGHTRQCQAQQPATWAASGDSQVSFSFEVVGMLCRSSPGQFCPRTLTPIHSLTRVTGTEQLSLLERGILCFSSQGNQSYSH